jgi:hypothetical protein
MAKPSIFSSNYKEQRRKRRINLFLFILLIICISFFGGKYYLRSHDVPFVDKIVNSKIVKDISHYDWISKVKEKFAKKVTKVEVTPDTTKPAVPAQIATTPASVTTNTNASTEKQTFEYSYQGLDGKTYYVEYEKVDSRVVINGLKDETNTSDYSISKDKSKIVFDVKSDNNLILCDSLGNFKVISRPDYKMKSTGKIIPKETILNEYKGYIWAQKPCFTLDGRIIYVSRLPYIRKDNTLYIWSMNIDGTNNKKLSMINHDISKVSYGGFDDKNRLKVVVEGVQYYIDNGSYMLVK